MTVGRSMGAMTGEELLTMRGHTGEVVGVTYSPDGRHLASTSRRLLPNCCCSANRVAWSSFIAPS
jgi:hypothetical protein